METTKKTLLIVKDSPAKWGEVSDSDYSFEIYWAKQCMYEDPKWNLNRAIEAIVLACKKLPITPDFIAVIGEWLADVSMSSQTFFDELVTEKLREAGINVGVFGSRGTSGSLFIKNFHDSFLEDTGVKWIEEMEIYSFEVAQGKIYPFNYRWEGSDDKGVVVYKITPKK